MPFEIITLNTNWKKRVLIVSKKFSWKYPMKPNNHIVIDLVVTWKVTKCCMKKIYPSLWPHVGSCWNFIFLPQKCRILKILNWGGQLNWTDQLIDCGHIRGRRAYVKVFTPTVVTTTHNFWQKTKFYHFWWLAP